ncbi:MAG TPA: MFS transporter [Chloroflexota bacterium]|nr:MFS transporter [Chloroflexota bacterium]
MDDTVSAEAIPLAVLPAPKPVPLLRNRDYMLLWAGQLVSSVGGGVSGLAFPLLVLAITGSPADAGFAGLLRSLPYLIFSLPAGALVDRWDRKRVMIICDSIRALNAASIPIAAAFGHLGLGQLLVTTTIEGTCFVFFNISEVACLPKVVTKEQIPAASSQNQAGEIIGGLAAPPLGGALFQIARSVPFLVDAISYAASVCSLFLIHTTFQEARTAAPRSLRVEIAEGVRWLWGQPLIRFMAVLTGGLNFTTAGLDLMMIVIARQQHAPAAAIGLIFTIGGLGALAGAMAAPRIQRRFRFGSVIISTMWIQALAFPLFAVAPNVVFLGLVAAVLFVTGPIYNAVQFSYRLSLIPDELQGRVNSVFRLAAFGFIPLGTAAAGILLQAFGPDTTVLLFAAVTLSLAALASLNSHVRRAPRPEAATA